MSNKDKQQAVQAARADQATQDLEKELADLREQVRAHQEQAEQLRQEIAQHKARADSDADALKELQKINARLGRQLREQSGAQAAQSASGTHIRVAALSDGYFRAGLQFSRQAREVAIGDLTEEQLQAIRSDARLVVVDL